MIARAATRAAIHAAAAVDARLGADGRTELAVLSSQAPLLLRGRRAAAAGTAAVVHLVGGAAGPLAGDQLSLALRVGPGAALTLRSVAATVALPGRADEPSRLRIEASVAAGGTLVVTPEPTVAAAGCRHEVVADVELAAGASLLWRDELLLGRYGEKPGRLSVTLRADLDGAPLVRHQVVLGPQEPGLAGPAVLGGAGAVGTVLVSGPPWIPPEPGNGAPAGATGTGNGPAAAAGNGHRAAHGHAGDPAGPPPFHADGVDTLPLAGSGLLITALAGDAVVLRHRLDAALVALRVDERSGMPVPAAAQTPPGRSVPDFG